VAHCQIAPWQSPLILLMSARMPRIGSDSAKPVLVVGADMLRSCPDAQPPGTVCVWWVISADVGALDLKSGALLGHRIPTLLGVVGVGGPAGECRHPSG
jgi:hypothetical protein